MRAARRNKSLSLIVAAALLAAVGLTATNARANGRFPESQRLLEHPTDPNRLYLTATYGLLVTEDRGRNWFYVCELAFALKFLQGDPLLEVFPDGSMLAGIYDTANLSSDCGCTWRTVLGESATQFVLDVATDASGKVLALLRDDTVSPSTLFVMESSDRGKTWVKISDLPAAVTDGYTIDVAPSDPSRLYVSAFVLGRNIGVLLASRDRGQTWEQADIPGTSGSIKPFIAAVHPSNRDRIFVRTDNWEGTGAFAAQDGLLHSGDGGKTWTEVLHREAKLFGFALSPDGNTVLAGYGDPFEAAGRSTNSDDFGVYKASTQDFAFEKIFATTVACLRWTATGVYVCTVPLDPSTQALALGFAPNADFTLATKDPFTSLLDLRNVRGPLGCVAATCNETWSAGTAGTPPICQVLQARCDPDTSANNLTCGNVGGTGGMGGSGGDASGLGGGDGGMKPGGGSSGCSCRAAGDSRAPDWAWTGLALLTFGCVARRRRYRGRHGFRGMPTQSLAGSSVKSWRT